MKNTTIAILLLGSLTCLAMKDLTNQEQPLWQINYVPNDTTAIKVAEAILEGFIGKEEVNLIKPFKANLESGIWQVDGAPPKALGGTMHVRLQASDCKVLKVWGESKVS